MKTKFRGLASRVLAFALFLFTAVLATTLPAQESPDPKIPPVQERIEVSLVPLDVTVTDKQGNFITALNRTDFEVYEDGKRVPLESFFEVADNKLMRRRLERDAQLEPSETPAGEGAAAPPDFLPNISKRIVVCFDTTEMNPSHRQHISKALRQGLADMLVPGDKALFAVISPTLRVLGEWTDDPDAIDAALDKVEKGAGGMGFLTRRQAYEGVLSSRRSMVAMGHARSYAQQARDSARRVVDALGSLLESQRGVPGKKIVLFVSGNLPLTPGLDVFYAVQDRFFASGAFNEAQSYSLAREIEQESRKWATWGYTVNALDARGLDASAVDFGAQYRTPMFAGSGAASAAKTNGQESLLVIAKATGGQAILDTNDFATRIRSTAHFSGHYYALGYAPPHGDDGKFHEIEVKLANPEFRISHRQGYQSPKP